MKNAIIMYLSTVLDIVLGESSFKIIQSFSFLLIWDPVLVDWYQNPSGYIQ